jgi:Zn-dependent peptidase ImmA (M78 family)
VGSLHSNRGAKRAREAREALRLGAATPLACLLSAVEERAGLPAVVARLPPDVAGACHREGDAAVLWVNGTQPAVRRRFTLAHELGHVWCRHQGRLEVDSVGILSDGTKNPIEVQANAFAAELLLPKAAVRGLLDRAPSLEEVVVLAARYGVSALVALFRLTSAGVTGGERAQRLREEIDAGEHHATFARLGLESLEDRLGAIVELPYTSPVLAGSALIAMLGGKVTVTAGAHAAGVDPRRLAPALEAIVAPKY